MLRIFNTKSTIKPKTMPCFNRKFSTQHKFNKLYERNKKIDSTRYPNGEYYKFEKYSGLINNDFIKKSVFSKYEKINNNINNGVNDIMEQEYELQQKRKNIKKLDEIIGIKLKEKLLKGETINYSDTEELIKIIDKLQERDETIDIELILLISMIVSFIMILLNKYIVNKYGGIKNAEELHNKLYGDEIFNEGDIIKIKKQVNEAKENIQNLYKRVYGD